MKRLRHYDKAQLFRLSANDYQELEDIAVKLGLPLSEITRRSLRIALPILRDLNLPGTSRQGRPEVKSTG